MQSAKYSHLSRKRTASEMSLSNHSSKKTKSNEEVESYKKYSPPRHRATCLQPFTHSASRTSSHLSSAKSKHSAEGLHGHGHALHETSSVSSILPETSDQLVVAESQLVAPTLDSVAETAKKEGLEEALRQIGSLFDYTLRRNPTHNYPSAIELCV